MCLIVWCGLYVGKNAETGAASDDATYNPENMVNLGCDFTIQGKNKSRATPLDQNHCFSQHVPDQRDSPWSWSLGPSRSVLLPLWPQSCWKLHLTSPARMEATPPESLALPHPLPPLPLCWIQTPRWRGSLQVSPNSTLWWATKPPSFKTQADEWRNKYGLWERPTSSFRVVVVGVAIGADGLHPCAAAGALLAGEVVLTQVATEQLQGAVLWNAVNVTSGCAGAELAPSSGFSHWDSGGRTESVGVVTHNESFPFQVFTHPLSPSCSSMCALRLSCPPPTQGLAVGAWVSGSFSPCCCVSCWACPAVLPETSPAKKATPGVPPGVPPWVVALLTSEQVCRVLRRIHAVANWLSLLNYCSILIRFI